MPYEFGDVILIPFPFSDQVGQKQRPVSSSAPPSSPSIFTVVQPLVRRKLGKLSADDRAALTSALEEIIGRE